MHKTATNGVKDIYFLCSPSLGILDNWLPVLYRLKKLAPHVNILLFFPKVSIAEQISSNNVLVDIGEEVFSDVIVLWYDGNWKHANSMLEAKKMAETAVTERFLHSCANKFKSRGILIISGFIQFLINILSKYVFCRSDFNQFGLRDSSVVVYDVYEETKPYWDDFFDLIEDGVKKYSICHGIDINCDPIVDRSAAVCVDEGMLVYLFSKTEVHYYHYSFGIPKSKLKIVGIPRHDDDWVRFVQNRVLKNTYDGDNDGAPQVVLFSRSLSSYLPLERKIKALKLIKKHIIDRHKFRLVIKIHPKEVNSIHIFYDIFGKDNLDVTWRISNLHPFSLAKLSKFAIVFYSGVAIDMNYLGIPVIEYLNMNELEKHDTQRSLRKNGVPVFSYRYLGFVKGASSENELVQAIDTCVSDTDNLARALRKKYDFYFPKTKDLSDSIAESILSGA